MPETTDWAEHIDAIVADAIAQQNVGMLRSRILELVQHAYSQGIGASAELAHRRQLVASLVPACVQEGQPSIRDVEYAQQLVDAIYETVK